MNRILICNCCADDHFAKISRYLLETKKDVVLEGIRQKASEIQAEEVIILIPIGSQIEIAQEFKVYPVSESMITANPFAAVEAMKGKMPRPTVSEEPAVYEDHEVVMIRPEEAYQIARESKSEAPIKVMFLNYKGKTEIIETAYGSGLSDILAENSIPLDMLKGILLGGIKGKFVKSNDLAEYKVTKDSLYDSMNFYYSEACMVDELKKLSRLIQNTSCGKCVLCREGSLQYMTIVEDITAGKAKMPDIELVKEISGLIEVGSYCTFGQSMPRLFVSGLELFGDEIETHIKKKSCPAGVCDAFASYCILPKACTGCEDCLDACDEDAIEGKAGFIHMIDEDLCTKCGKCVAACEEGAIIKVTGSKPKLPLKLTKVGKF